MKTTSIKWIIPLFLGVLMALNSMSQDSTKASVDSLLKKEIAADGGSNNTISKNSKKRQVKKDSLKISNDSSKLDREEKEIKRPALEEKKVIGQAEEVEATGESKIEELSNLISRANIFYTIVFLLFGFMVIKVITFILNALAERSTKYRIAFKGSIPIVKIIGWVIIITLVIVVIFKPSVASMLAVSASIGVAIGFASQDILKNIFGGVVILLDRPFVSGDKIEVDKYYGEVVEIGLRSTRIVTPDDSLVSVPNAVMMSSSLSNSNAGEPNCQVVAEIYLPLTVDTIKTREIATQAATVSKYIYLGKPITVLFINEINQHHSYYKMKVKAYVMDIRHEFTFKSDMTELIIKELLKEGMINGEF